MGKGRKRARGVVRWVPCQGGGERGSCYATTVARWWPCHLEPSTIGNVGHQLPRTLVEGAAGIAHACLVAPAATCSLGQSYIRACEGCPAKRLPVSNGFGLVTSCPDECTLARGLADAADASPLALCGQCGGERKACPVVKSNRGGKVSWDIRLIAIVGALV